MNILFSITQLKYLIEVDRLKSFGLAAKACNVSQPTLSMQIQKLEEDYGMQVFVRSNRKVETTEKGKEILALARELVAQAAFIDSKLRNEPLSMEGDFRVGIIPTVSPYLLPLFLEKFQKKYTSTNLIVEEIRTSFLLEEIKSNHIDLGILAGPLEMSGLREESLYFEKFLVYLPPDSKLLSKASLDKKDLNENEILLLQDGHCFKEQTLDICGARVKDPAYSIQAGSIQTLTHLVDTKLGFTLIPELATSYLNSSQKKQVRPIKQSPYREITLVFARSFRRQKLIETLIREIRSSLPKYIETSKPKNVIPLHL